MQASPAQISCTAFLEKDCFAKGTLHYIVEIAKDTLEDSKLIQLLIFDDLTGKPLDIDFRGNTAEVLERLNSQAGRIPDTKKMNNPLAGLAVPSWAWCPVKLLCFPGIGTGLKLNPEELP